MATVNFTPLLGMALPTSGDLSGTWGTEVNNFITTYVDAGVAGTQTISGTQTAVTLSITNGNSLVQVGAGATGSAQYAVINCTGNPASTLVITVPSSSKTYLVNNATSTSQSVTVKGAATTGVTLTAGERAIIAWNGTDFIVVATNNVASTALTGTLPVSRGGTGNTTAQAEMNRVAGAVTSGQYLRGNGTNVVMSAIQAGDVPTLNQNTTGTASNVTGTVAVANGGSGQTTAQSAMNTFAGAVTSGSYLRGNGTNVVMSAIQAGDVPTLNQNTTGTASNVTGTVAVANGGSGQTTAQAAMNTFAGAVTNAQYLRGNGTNVVMSAIQAADVPTLNQNTTGTAANVTGTVAIANGGTGGTTQATARTGLGATTVGANLFTITDPSAFTYIRINSDNTVSALTATDFRTAIGAGTGNGTVTSVGATSPVASSGGTAPTISLNANYGDTLNPYASKTANNFLAAPNGSAGAPTFRAIVAADIPTLNQNTTGTAANVTGTVAIANGGTGATSAANAATALGVGTSSNVQFNSLGIGTAASATAGEIRATNNVTAFFTSDRKFKENIRDIPNALDAVDAIGGKLFDWTDAYIASKGGEDGFFVRKADFGVIAQDTQAAFPLAVRTREDGTLSVDYEKMCALAFAAIKELAARVKALEAR